MDRAENSSLIALAELQKMEQDRADHELARRAAEATARAQAERAAHAERERLQREAIERQRAEEAARQAELERRLAAEAAEAQRRLEAAERAARAEQDARLAHVQRELSAELDRRELRRTHRFAALGLGGAVLAGLAVIGTWFALPDSAPQAPIVAAADTSDDPLDELAAELAQLRADNAELRDGLDAARSLAEATTAEPPEPATDEEPTTPKTSKPKSKTKSRPKPKVTKPKPSPNADDSEPLIKKRDNPIDVTNDDRNPLAGIKD